MKDMGFHSHSEVFWTRAANGKVRIVGPNWIHCVDADTWASIVASVSATGETSDAFRQAELLHAGPAKK
jgi:hypothetical protein